MVKYFEVHKEELRGSLMSGEVYADGEYINEADELEIRTITTGFSVYEYDEQGVRTGTEFFPVHIDTNTWEDDADKVLDIIRRTYPADNGWQNNAW